MSCNVLATLLILFTALGVTLWYRLPKISLRRSHACTYLVCYTIIVVVLGIMTFSGTFGDRKEQQARSAIALGRTTEVVDNVVGGADGEEM